MADGFSLRPPPGTGIANFHDVGQRPGSWKTSTLTRTLPCAAWITGQAVPLHCGSSQHRPMRTRDVHIIH